MNQDQHYFDVAIVGAGPAGSHLASRLAENGYRIAMIDPKAPWEKPCGGGITHKAWSRFPILADPSLDANQVMTSIQISRSGRFFIIDQGHPLLMVHRKDLAKVMLENALAKGAVHLPHEIIDVERKDGKSHLRTKDGTMIKSDFVVGADGTRSIVRKCILGPIPRSRTLIAIHQFYETKPGDPTLIHVTPFPGYIWAFPRKDRLAVGIGSLEKGHNLKPHLDDFIQEYFPGRKPLGPIEGAQLPYMKGLDAYREPRVGPGWALIGDAAGFCDTLTGEGILYALWSADLFADAFCKGRPEFYDSNWRKAFGFHLLFGGWIAKWLFSSKNIDRFFMGITACPAFRKVFMDFVWNLPSYPVLFSKLLLSLPRALIQWRQFLAAGGRIDPDSLGPFKSLEEKLLLDWR